MDSASGELAFNNVADGYATPPSPDRIRVLESRVSDVVAWTGVRVAVPSGHSLATWGEPTADGMLPEHPLDLCLAGSSYLISGDRAWATAVDDGVVSWVNVDDWLDAISPIPWRIQDQVNP